MKPKKAAYAVLCRVDDRRFRNSILARRSTPTMKRNLNESRMIPVYSLASFQHNCISKDRSVQMTAYLGGVDS